tara:strand:+ start:2548 stop:3900 length:1353 start_codon:yes stop_codon:yes gene_type:complete
MPTKYNIKGGPHQQDTGYSNPDIVDDLVIPPCTIEDVDRGLFELFNEELPLFYKRHGNVKRVPVIFATGERFALLARNKPLRDKNNALILPLISIVRTGIDQEGAKGNTLAQGGPSIVKVRLSEKDARYQRLMNRFGFKNDDAIAVDANSTVKSSGIGGGTAPDRLATRRAPPNITVSARRGTLLPPNFSKNIIEFLEIPPIKQYTASYEVTFWTQYTQEMNSLLTVMMNGYVENRRRTYVIKTREGYRFTAFVDAALSPQNNFDDFTDSERLVKYTCSISVTAYVVAPNEEGLPAPVRRQISAPDMSFDSSTGIGGLLASSPPGAPIPSGDPMAYILSDAMTESDPMPGGGIGSNGADVALNMATQLAVGFPGLESVTIGGTNSANVGTTGKQGGSTTIITTRDPFTGKPVRTTYAVKTANPNKGETVFGQSNQPGGAFIEGLELNLED